jgi:hypothetical protein
MIATTIRVAGAAALGGIAGLLGGLFGSMGIMTMMRFNQLQPPFNNLKIWHAMLLVVDQADFMTALAGPEALEGMRLVLYLRWVDGKRGRVADPHRPARFRGGEATDREAGYNGEKITVLDSVELANSHIPALVTVDLLKREREQCVRSARPSGATGKSGGIDSAAIEYEPEVLEAPRPRSSVGNWRRPCFPSSQ